MIAWIVAGLAAVAMASIVPPPAPRPPPASRAGPVRLPSTTDQGPPRWRPVATAAAGIMAALMIGGPYAVVAGMIAASVCWRVVGTMENPALRVRRESLCLGLPHVVDLMAACLAAGASPEAALGTVAEAVDSPMREELAMVTGRIRVGVDPVRVWSELAAHPQLGPLGRCIARATDSGASVADAMHRLANDQRQAGRAAVEHRARSVGVKAAVPLGICLLPAFILIGIVPLVAGSLRIFLTR